jgi:hypothetical protein
VTILWYSEGDSLHEEAIIKRWDWKSFRRKIKFLADIPNDFEALLTRVDDSGAHFYLNTGFGISAKFEEQIDEVRIDLQFEPTDVKIEEISPGDTAQIIGLTEGGEKRGWSIDGDGDIAVGSTVNVGVAKLEGTAKVAVKYGKAVNFQSTYSYPKEIYTISASGPFNNTARWTIRTKKGQVGTQGQFLVGVGFRLNGNIEAIKQNIHEYGLIPNVTINGMTAKEVTRRIIRLDLESSELQDKIKSA